MKLNKLNLSIKTRYIQTIALKLVYALIGAIILLAFIAPYLNIFLDKTSTVKVFGFKNFRTFRAYVIGLPSSLMVCSFLLLYISLKTKYSIGRLASCLFLYSSFFQFIWIFWDAPDLPKTLYHISIAIGSFFAFIVVKFFVQRNIKRAANEKEFRQNAKKFIAEVKSRMDDQQIDSL